MAIFSAVKITSQSPARSTQKLPSQADIRCAISAAISTAGKRLDLGKRTEEAMRGGYGNLMRVCTAARLPPLPPEEVRRRLQHEKTFTQGAADVDAVDKLYRTFFEFVAGHAKDLHFVDLGWGEAEARQLAAVLPRFAALTSLDVSDNEELGEQGVTAICDALQSNKETKLVSLNVSETGIGPAGAKAVVAMAAVVTAVEMSTAAMAAPKAETFICSVHRLEPGIGELPG